MNYCPFEVSVDKKFKYDLNMSLAEHKAMRSKDRACHISGAQAFKSWLDAETFEETIRNAVTLQTDADTVADIAGALAAATPGMEVPQEWADKAFGMLDDELKEYFVRFSNQRLS